MNFLSNILDSILHSKGGKNGIDMCSGPLLPKIIAYVIPMLLTYLIQLTFNAADLIVVGRYASHRAMAAVGATSSYCNLLVILFTGLAIGVNVTAARYYGAKDRDGFSRTMHTAVVTSVIGGAVSAIVTLLVSRCALKMMKTPEEVLDQACVYMYIYAIGIPFMIIYNFCCSILQALGDTKRPLYMLCIAGSLNVVLNLFTVIVLHMDVAGVALATAISQMLSAYMAVNVLKKGEEAPKLRREKLKIDRKILLEIMKIGVPTGIQGSFFSISNVLIQSSINSFGELAVAGSTAASNIEGLVYAFVFCSYSACQSFVGQNYGARKYDRIAWSILHCLWCGFAASALAGSVILFYGREILEIYNADPMVIEWGMLHLRVLTFTYALCALMDVISSGMRAVGHPVLSAVNVLICVCVLRIVWIHTVFNAHHSMTVLLISYPVSWILAFLVNGSLMLFAYRRLGRKWGVC